MTRSGGRKVSAGTVVKWALVVAAVVFLVIALRNEWPEVREAIREVPVWALVAALVSAMAAVAVSGAQQRSLLLTLGVPRVPRRPWFRVFFAAQLGKYLPGSAWAYVAQMELSRQLGVRRAVSVVTILLGAGITVLQAFVFGAVLIGQPSLDAVPVWAQVVLAVLAVLALVVVLARPRLVTSALGLLPKRVRKDRFGDIEVGSLAMPAVWSAVAWVAYGLHFWFLVLPFVDEPAQSLRLALGGFPLAWAIGFLVFFVPAGVGVREVVLAAALAPVLGTGVALTVATLSRFVIIVAEALLAASAPFLGGRRAASEDLSPAEGAAAG